MKTKLMKIGMIAIVCTFVFSGPSWAKNNHQHSKHNENHHKRVYGDDHVKKRYNGAEHWRHQFRKGHHRYYRPFNEYRPYRRYYHYRPYHHQYRHHHYRKHHRRFDRHHSNNDVLIIGSVFEPGWGFTFATKGQY